MERPNRPAANRDAMMIGGPTVVMVVASRRDQSPTPACLSRPAAKCERDDLTPSPSTLGSEARISQIAIPDPSRNATADLPRFEPHVI